MAKKIKFGLRNVGLTDSARTSQVLVDMETGIPIEGVQSLQTRDVGGTQVVTATLTLAALPTYEEPMPKSEARASGAAATEPPPGGEGKAVR